MSSGGNVVSHQILAYFVIALASGAVKIVDLIARGPSAGFQAAAAAA